MICLHKMYFTHHTHHNFYLSLIDCTIHTCTSGLACSRRACGVTICLLSSHSQLWQMYIEIKMCHVFELYHETMHDTNTPPSKTPNTHYALANYLPCHRRIKWDRVWEFGSKVLCVLFSGCIQKIPTSGWKLQHIYFHRDCAEPHSQCFNFKTTAEETKYHKKS